MAIIDGRTLEDGTNVRCDICIVGAGAAGITLALELMRTGLSVLLLESGDRKPDADTQNLYDGEVANPALHSLPRYYRMRRFGGSTTKWGGGCVPFDPIDFERRDYIPESGWPFGREELDGYYPRTNELLEAGEFAYDAAEALPDAPREMIPGYASTRSSTRLLERNSPPTDFGRRYGRALRDARNVRVLLNSNCVNLAPTPEGRAIARLDAATLAGNRFTVAARHYVLATGGLETPRILLASRDVHRNGVGNDEDLVGRYYMRHLSASVGRLRLGVPHDGLNYGIRKSADGVYCRRLFALSAEEQRERRIANVILRLWHLPIADPAHRSGALSGVFLAHYLFPYERRKWLRGEAPIRHNIPRHLFNILTDPVDTTRFTLHMLRNFGLARRKYPAVTPRSRTGEYALNFVAEQQPNPESRVVLTERRDALGMQKIRIDWRYTDFDAHSIKSTYQVIAEDVARSGAGSVEYSEGDIDLSLSRNGAFDGHQIGTTRMSDDPRRGVVDRNCRVHGVENLFVASSSVFPTGSHALPTLTIVAIAARLATHVGTLARTPLPAMEGALAG